MTLRKIKYWKKSGRSMLLFMSLAIITLIAMTGSCTTFAKRKMDVVITAAEELEGKEGVFIAVHQPEIEYAETSLRRTYPLSRIITAACTQRGIPAAAEMEIPRNIDPEKTLQLDIWIKEETFFKELNSLSSITALFTLRDSYSSREYLTLIYTEESSGSLDNFYHLYTIINRCMDRLSSEMNKAIQ